MSSGVAANGTIKPLTELLSKINRIRRVDGKASLVGVDGLGGSGKSTLAATLAQIARDCSVVEMDDFYMPSRSRPPTTQQIGGGFDWIRLREQVLIPLSEGRDGRFQRYDWGLGDLAEWREVSNRGIIFVEGVYTTRRELKDFYDFRIWVETSRDVRLARGLARDGESTRERWLKEWMPAEDAYAADHSPIESAHVVVIGNAVASVDPGSHFVEGDKGPGR